MDAPAIKGSVLQAVVDDVARIATEGRISEEELAVRLEAEDLALLDAKIQPALWYPIRSYERLSQILLEVEGGGDLAYLVKRGARAAERLFESGLYDQLRVGEDRATRHRDAGSTWRESDGRLMATLAGVMFNFSFWKFEVADEDSEGHYRIEVTDARDLPEAARYAAQGFIQYSAERLTQGPVDIESTRPHANHILYSLTRGRRRAA